MGPAINAKTVRTSGVVTSESIPKAFYFALLNKASSTYFNSVGVKVSLMCSLPPGMNVAFN